MRGSNRVKRLYFMHLSFHDLLVCVKAYCERSETGADYEL